MRNTTRSGSSGRGTGKPRYYVVPAKDVSSGPTQLTTLVCALVIAVAAVIVFVVVTR